MCCEVDTNKPSCVSFRYNVSSRLAPYYLDCAHYNYYVSGPEVIILWFYDEELGDLRLNDKGWFQIVYVILCYA